MNAKGIIIDETSIIHSSEFLIQKSKLDEFFRSHYARLGEKEIEEAVDRIIDNCLSIEPDIIIMLENKDGVSNS